MICISLCSVEHNKTSISNKNSTVYPISNSNSSSSAPALDMSTLTLNAPKCQVATNQSKYFPISEQTISSDPTKFIFCLQNNIVFISNTHPFAGIYTENVQTCICWCIQGTNGIVMIHDSLRLSYQSIIEAFQMVGTFQQWCVWHNEHLTDATINAKKRIKSTCALLEQVGFMKTMQVPVLRSLPLSCITRDFEGTPEARFILTNQFQVQSGLSLNYDNNLIESPYRAFRYQINVLNNFFISPIESLPADILFDGIKFTCPPPLYQSLNVIETFHQQVLLTSQINPNEQTLQSLEVSTHFFARYQQYWNANNKQILDYIKNPEPL
jgi:hypothetical protein